MEFKISHTSPGNPDPGADMSTSASSGAERLGDSAASIVAEDSARSVTRRSGGEHHHNLSQTEDLETLQPVPHRSDTKVLQVFRTLEKDETVDLVDTIQTIFEGSESVRHAGVVLLNAPHLVSKPNSIVLPVESPDFEFESSAHRTSVPRNLRGLGLVIKTHAAKLGITRPQFQVPKILNQDDMEKCFEEAIRSKSQYKTMPYFNIDLADESCRPNDDFELECGMPMDKLSYGAGINTPYGYYSSGVSVFGAHVEDFNFGSYNVVFAGAPKLWICVKPGRSQQLLEQKLRELYPKAGKCAQFVRHLAMVLTPQTLRTWGVEHYFVPQYPGHIVAVTGQTYHWGINTGQNYAEAINFCLERDWQPNDEIPKCYDGCGFNYAGAVPLPMPRYEEGTLEEKIQRAKLDYERLLNEHDARLAALQDKKRVPATSKAGNATSRRANPERTFQPNTSKASRKTVPEDSDDTGDFSNKESSNDEASGASRATTRAKRSGVSQGSVQAAPQILKTNTTGLGRMIADAVQAALRPIAAEFKALKQQQEQMMLVQDMRNRLLEGIAITSGRRRDSMLSQVQQRTEGLAKVVPMTTTTSTMANPTVTVSVKPDVPRPYFEGDSDLSSEGSCFQESHAGADDAKKTARGVTKVKDSQAAGSQQRRAGEVKRSNTIQPHQEGISPSLSPSSSLSELPEDLWDELNGEVIDDQQAPLEQATEEQISYDISPADSMSVDEEAPNAASDPDTVADILNMLGPHCKTCKFISISGCDRGHPCGVCLRDGTTCRYGQRSLSTVPAWQRHVLTSLSNGRPPHDRGGVSASSKLYYQNYMSRLGRLDLVDALTWLPDDGPVGSKMESKMARKRGFDEVSVGSGHASDEGAGREPKRPRAE